MDRPTAFKRMRNYAADALTRMTGWTVWHKERAMDRGLEDGAGYAALDEMLDAIRALQAAYDAGKGCKIQIAILAFHDGAFILPNGETPDEDDQKFLDLAARVLAAIERAKAAAESDWDEAWDYAKTPKQNFHTARAFQSRELETSNLRELYRTVLGIENDIFYLRDGLYPAPDAVLRSAERLARAPGYPGG